MSIKVRELNAQGIGYRILNESIHQLLVGGTEEIVVKNVSGQRFIGCGINGRKKLVIEGLPGNDLGSYMNGAWIEVYGNAQDGIGNTMNSGTIVVHGYAGDIVGYAMRGGIIYIKGNVGYRSGIHMKAYGDKKPVIVVGGRAGNFLGEYMAGGIIIVLGYGLTPGQSIVGSYVGTGMHGGKMYLRGEVEREKLAKEVAISDLTQEDIDLLQDYTAKYANIFGVILDANNQHWTKLVPASSRPYGELYNHQ